ncbi:MAG: alanine racemase [Syntrophales bacterium]|nr:alanine racemase [Syntrophales bacterium]
MTEEQAYRSWVEVDLDNFKKNLAEIRRLIGTKTKIMQVVKADAYGHGAIEIANVALQNGASYLGVANADEGIQLRVTGIEQPIVILSPSPIGEIQDIIKYRLIPSVSDMAFAQELDRQCQRAQVILPVHVEVDTGMGRGGILSDEAVKIIERIASLSNIVIEGIFTHLASAEIKEDEYNRLQWAKFKTLLDKLAAKGLSIPLRHISNSGGILNFRSFDLDMVRPGLMSYGIYPARETMERASIVPVMSFKTRIVLLKEFPPGYSIGYNRTYTTCRPTKIATIPIGYGDGYGVVLSNQGEVLVRGKKAPVIGRVSMDMCTVDVTDIPGCEIGDEVVILGRQGNETITATDIAERAGTHAYEILCTLGKRAPRIFLQSGKPDSILPRLRRIFIPEEEKSLARIGNIIRHCFQARARDTEVGDAIYYEIFETLFGKENRPLELREDFFYRIDVSEFADEEIISLGYRPDALRMTTHIEYTKILRNHEFIIGCAFDEEQLSSFFEDPRCEYRWVLNRDDRINLEKDFQVNRVTIDGEPVPVLKAGITSRGYEVVCGTEKLKEKRDQRVKFTIEIFTRKSKSNNLFTVYLVYPTRGLNIEFNYEQARLRNVREVFFFAGKQLKPEVIKQKGKSILIKVGDDRWIFPVSGVAFIWDTF